MIIPQTTKDIVRLRVYEQYETDYLKLYKIDPIGAERKRMRYIQENFGKELEEEMRKKSEKEKAKTGLLGKFRSLV